MQGGERARAHIAFQILPDTSASTDVLAQEEELRLGSCLRQKSLHVFMPSKQHRQVAIPHSTEVIFRPPGHPTEQISSGADVRS